MRISTLGITNGALFNLLTQQAQLSKTQSQIASGKRIQTPADDPVASVHVLELQRALAESEQFGKNADSATNRLNLEEQVLGDVGKLIQTVKESAIRANSGIVDANGRRLIATEVRARLSELIDIANRRDVNGEFLFSGYATQTQPFSQSGTSVGYFGDQGGRVLQVGPEQRVADSHSGFDVFVKTPEGNGTFVTNANPANTGSGVITGGAVTDSTQYIADDYTIRFTSATGNYEILDSSAGIIGTGVYASNSVISFRGANVNITGTPAANDTFTVARARTEDLFTTLNSLITTLETPAASSGQRAQLNSDLATVLVQLDTAQDHLLGVRAEVGARLSALDTAETARADQELELKRITSDLRDLDYAEALTRMNQQLLGLQAAQQSYSRISQLSLFDYLR